MVVRVKIHELKIYPEFFELVLQGKKKFELRKDDRGFAEGDYILLKEFNPEDGSFTGRERKYIISYILRDFIGLTSGYVIMSIEPA